MSKRKFATLITLTAAFLGFSSLVSFAAPAISKASLNIRSGPGTVYKVVDTLYRGEKVDVGECVSNGWCYIKHSGPDGWVSAKYLRAVVRQQPRQPRYNPPPRAPQNPPISFGLSFNSNGDVSFGVGIGQNSNQNNIPLPLYSPPAPQVCFYKGINFSGQKYCLSSGEEYSSLPYNWNDQISSIRVMNGARAKICRWENFRGGCQNINSNRSSLSYRFDDRISSLKIF